MSQENPEGRIYIEELGRLIERSVQTIYMWVRKGELPPELQPEREGGRQKLYWHPEQVDPLKEWAIAKAAAWRGPQPGR